MFKRLKSKIIACFSVLGLGVTAFTLTPNASVYDEYPINQHIDKLNLANRQYNNQGYGQAINYFVGDTGIYDQFVTSANTWNITFKAMTKTDKYYLYLVDWDAPITRLAVQLLAGGSVVAGVQIIPVPDAVNVVQFSLPENVSAVDTIKLQAITSMQDQIGRIILYDASIFDLYVDDVNDAYERGVYVGSGAEVEPSIINLFGAIANVPITILGGMMSFEVLGQKYFTIFASFLSLAVVLWIIKKVI